jgi:hypothetical protein
MLGTDSWIFVVKSMVKDKTISNYESHEKYKIFIRTTHACKAQPGMKITFLTGLTGLTGFYQSYMSHFSINDALHFMKSCKSRKSCLN